MQEIPINLDSLQRNTDLPDCGRGHACQFCPKETDCRLDKSRHDSELIASRLADIGQIILVMANKGGVGKSTVASSLAASLAAAGYRTGMADADIHGPNQSRFFGLAGQSVRLSHAGLQTGVFSHDSLRHDIRVGSLAFLMENDHSPIIWRDAYKHDFIHHLVGSFDWGPLDFLVIDMPPGTGNELITLADILENTDVAGLVVTTPQQIALMDSLKVVTFCRDRQLPLLGVVENMAGVICPGCDSHFHVFPREHMSQVLEDFRLQSLAQLPLDPLVAQGSDNGIPDVLVRPDGLVAQAFSNVVDAACQALEQARAAAANSALAASLEHPLDDEHVVNELAQLPAHQQRAVKQELRSLIQTESNRLHTHPKEEL